MKVQGILILLLAAAACCSCAVETTGLTSERSLASASLQDVVYDFDQSKLEAVPNAFHFMRTYVDYFYLIVAKNRNDFNVRKLQSFVGWCVGDAHPENFGLLLQKDGTRLFTMNDMDDAGSCPVAMDLLRLMVASHLYSQDMKIDKIRNAYLDGLQGKTQTPPSSIAEMLKESEKKSEDPDPKKVSNDRFVRNNQMNEVNESLALEISNQVRNLFPKYEIMDIVETSKVSGGSGGLIRYEILLKNKNGLRHLEFKQEIRPSIYPVATLPIPSTDQRLQKTIAYEQGGNPSPFYSYVKINGMEMLVRPRFETDIGVNLEKQTLSDNEDIICYEAFILGTLHRKSVSQIGDYLQAIQDLKSSDWGSDVDKINNHFQNKYRVLIGKVWPR